MKIKMLILTTLLVAGVVHADHYNWVGSLWVPPGTDWTATTSWFVQETGGAATALPGAATHVIIDEYLYGNHITTMPTLSANIGAVQYLTLGWDNVGTTSMNVADGGNVYVSGFATLGHLPGSSGTLNMTGGALVANILNVGNDGSGVANLSGNSLLHAGLVGFGSGGGVVSMAENALFVVNGDVTGSDLVGTGHVVALNAGESIREFYNADLARTEFSVIPEPSTLGLVALLGSGLLWVRKRSMI